MTKIMLGDTLVLRRKLKAEIKQTKARITQHNTDLALTEANMKRVDGGPKVKLQRIKAKLQSSKNKYCYLLSELEVLLSKVEQDLYELNATIETDRGEYE